ncbi:MAG: glycosyltransferase family 1 protein [Verrucomicrobiaceae bacterium]|nr:MAG: glycosyltransferase family 1 protein [Verrucomicrobiaceae bacterium]
MKHRMLFIDQSGQPGGAELCLADVAESMGGTSRVLLLSPGPFEDMLRARGIPCGVLPIPSGLSSVGKSASPFDYIRMAPKLAGFLSALRHEVRNCDILYLNTAKALLLGAAVAFGKPVVFHLHDLLTPDHFSSLNLRLIVLAANRSRGVIANSRATADAFRAAGGRTPVHVIPNGFDPERFSPRPDEELITLRRSTGIGKAPVAAVFGRISRWKGQDVLLRAAAMIPELVVWVVGEAVFTGDDRAYAGELKALASGSALQGRVFFLGHRDDIPQLMQAADVIVHTSVAPEPFGRVVVEGMLSGRPVIASRAGGPSEIIQDGVTGWLFEPGNSGELASLLRKVRDSPSRGRDEGLLASLEARKQYALPAVIEQTRRALNLMIPR